MICVLLDFGSPGLYQCAVLLMDSDISLEYSVSVIWLKLGIIY
jgi:hypothetical protein